MPPAPLYRCFLVKKRKRRLFRAHWPLSLSISFFDDNSFTDMTPADDDASRRLPRSKRVCRDIDAIRARMRRTRKARAMRYEQPLRCISRATSFIHAFISPRMTLTLQGAEKCRQLSPLPFLYASNAR